MDSHIYTELCGNMKVCILYQNPYVKVSLGGISFLGAHMCGVACPLICS